MGELPLKAALDYAAEGFHVFPVRGKVPLTANGFKDASLDLFKIAKWWEDHPHAGVGIRTGADSGIIVLDIDVQHGGAGSRAELERKHGQLPETAVALTGGGGNHLYFRHPGREVPNSAGKLGHGLDVRGDGGYVVAPPSVHENGREYKWLRPLDRDALADLPEWLFASGDDRQVAEPLGEVIPEGRRREALLSVAGTLRRRALEPNEILATLSKLNERCQPPLAASEIQELVTDVGTRYKPDAQAAIPTETPAEPRDLSATVAVFQDWLHLPDEGFLYAALATVAVNRLPAFDPLWLLIIGPSGGGKSETIQALGSLPDIHAASTLTEASLLSGTSGKDRAPGARGGHLREIGEYGILTLKDFGSVLSLRNEEKAGVLAALREIYDGSWVRLVGTDGGRKLEWHGKAGLIAGATPVIDQHHSVMAQLGERFLLYRLAVPDVVAHGRRSLAHQGREPEMRRALKESVRGLFASIDLSTPPDITETDTERLVHLAALVARARSPVIRDSYSREIELVPAAEAPGRIVGALARLLIGLRLIGLTNGVAWKVTLKCGLDSIPDVRYRALELLIATSEAKFPTKELALDLDLPTTTVRRTLEDLAAHGLIVRESEGEGKPDIWSVDSWTMEMWEAARA